MPTLIVPDRASNLDIKALQAAAVARGWQFAPVRYQLPKPFHADVPVLYGDPLFCDIVAAQLGVRLLEPSDNFLVRLPDAWRQRHVALTTLAQARLWESGSVFVKPAADKSFPARVYASGAALPGEEAVPGDTPILLSEPVQWEVEWRLFVCAGKVVTRSPYFRNGKLDLVARPDELSALRSFTKALLPEIESLLPPVAVLDIGKIAGKGWAVVEANPAWASGFYACDPKQALTALALATVPGDTQSDWLRPAAYLE
jgi:ATP-grasp domain, R2K clade family 2